MTQQSLAIFGGVKTIEKPIERMNSIGTEEIEATKSVIESGLLSKYLGCWHDDFYGGPQVQSFERHCEAYFGVKYAVTVNSWTSGLIAAVGAVDIEPGDEVIVSPWTMSASATSILHWNAIPVFADIEYETFCLDPSSVEANITPHTKAILAVDIFGHSADIDALMDIAERHGLKLITDTAQAPGSYYKGRKTGTLAHVGGYSLNYHKHIHTGEGGILVTNDDRIAERLQLIRNHAEAVVGGMGVTDLRNMIGYNFRLGEIESAIGIEQLKRLDGFIARRQKIADRLTHALSELPGLQPPMVKDDCTHVYYDYPLVVDVERIGVTRERLVEALTAEGVCALANGYANLHLLPMYQQKMAYGSSGFPWTSDICRRDVSYAKGICPVAESLHDTSFIGCGIFMHALSDDDVQNVIKAFQKVWNQLEALK